MNVRDAALLFKKKAILAQLKKHKLVSVQVHNYYDIVQVHTDDELYLKLSGDICQIVAR